MVVTTRRASRALPDVGDRIQVWWQVEKEITPNQEREKKRQKVEPEESDDPPNVTTLAKSNGLTAGAPAPVEHEEIEATNDFTDVVEVEPVWWGATVDKIEVASGRPYLATGRIVYDNFRAFDATVELVRFYPKFLIQEVRPKNLPPASKVSWEHCVPEHREDPAWPENSVHWEGQQASHAKAQELIALQEECKRLLDITKEADVRIERLEKKLNSHDGILRNIPPPATSDSELLNLLLDRVRSLLCIKFAGKVMPIISRILSMMWRAGRCRLK